MSESPFIRCYENMLEPFLCQSLVGKFDADDRRGPGKIEGYGYDVKRSSDLQISELPDWEYLCRAVHPGVSASLRRYRADVPAFDRTHTRAMHESGYQIQCYQPNGHDGFGWHADVNSRSSAERALAMIAYLNDVEEGGETEFQAHDLAIKPRRGSILWFPPTFPFIHRGKTPISGPKYIITCFLIYAR